MTILPFNLFALKPGRVHEAGGAGAPMFAAILAGRLGGTVLWIAEGWRRDTLNPVAFGQFADPAQLLLASVTDQTEALAVTEEALRSGAAALVVADLAGGDTRRPLSLTAGRRLQLAAEAGRATGLCLIAEGMGSNAAETRWQCDPVFDAVSGRDDSTLQRWQLTKNKEGTTGAWHVRWDAQTHRLDVVSPVAERPSSAGLPG